MVFVDVYRMFYGVFVCRPSPKGSVACKAKELVIADSAKATYNEGFLRVELPLQQPEARTRSVPVEVENR